MNPHLLRKFRQRRDVLGVIDIIRNGRYIGDFTRGTTKTYFDSTGTLQTAAINTLPWEYDPSTLLPIGFSFWEARTNSIRNNTMVGAAAGTPGTIPTNWARSASPFNGISSAISSVSTESGISYIDVRFTGTASSTFGYSINFDTNNAAAALQNQAWTVSSYISLSAGSLNGAVYQYVLSEYSAVPVFLANNFASTVSPTSGALTGKRTTYTATLSNASTAFVQPALAVNFANGLTYDFTLRIGMPQLELGSGATPVIATSGSAVARSADVASISGAGFSSLGIGTSGTIVTSFTPGAFPASGATFVVAASDGTSNNVIEQRAIVGGIFDYRVATGGVTQFDSTGVSAVAGTNYKQASAYSINDFAASIGGAASETDISGTVPTIDRLYIGSENGAAQCNGWIDYLGVIPGRQADYILQGRSQ